MLVLVFGWCQIYGEVCINKLSKFHVAFSQIHDITIEHLDAGNSVTLVLRDVIFSGPRRVTAASVPNRFNVSNGPDH